jgi:hypothetical protein
VDERQTTQRRSLLHSFGNGLSQAFEIALIPLIFGFGGHLVDVWLGSRFVFTLVLSLFGLTGVIVKLWCGYEYRMQQVEAEAPWRAPKRVARG